MIGNKVEVDLISALASKDVIAYSTYYTQNFQKFCLLANKYVKDIQVAEEIVQEIFIKLWTDANSLVNVESPKAYLAKTVVNSSLNWLKKQKSISKHHEKIAETSVREYGNDLLEEEELTVLIFREIDKLPPQCQKVFKLSRFDGKKYKEIATALNLSEKTVEAHVSHALKILRAKFFTDKSDRKLPNSKIYSIIFF